MSTMIDARAVPPKSQTPFGLPAWLIVFYYFLVLSATGLAVVAMEPLKMMMREAGVMAGPDQEASLVAFTTAGITASTLGAVTAGLLCDMAGPKISAMIAGFMFMSGYGLIFLVPPMNYYMIYTGFVILGLSYQTIFLSRTSVAELYPHKITIILAILGSGPDVSLAVPKLLYSFSVRAGITTVISIYMCVVAALIAADAFLVPWKPFESTAPPAAIKEADNDASALEIGAHTPLQSGATKVWGYVGMSPKSQLLTPHFWLFASFVFINMFRKTHFTQLARPIYDEVAKANGKDAEPLIELFMNTMPLTFIPALCMGFFTQHAGVTWGMFWVNTFSVITFGLTYIPIYWLQYITVFTYHLSAAYIIGIIFAFLASVYGMKTMPMLQAVQMLIGSVASAVFPMWYNRFVITLDSIRVANFVLFIIGLLNYAMPVYMWMYPPTRELSKEELGLVPGSTLQVDKDAQHRLSVAAFTGAVQGGDRKSIGMIENAMRK